jgi:hypothetical protein
MTFFVGGGKARDSIFRDGSGGDQPSEVIVSMPLFKVLVQSVRDHISYDGRTTLDPENWKATTASLKISSIIGMTISRVG